MKAGAKIDWHHPEWEPWMHGGMKPVAGGGKIAEV